MVTKKQLLQQIANLKNQVEAKTTDFITLKDLQRQLQITTAKLKASILNNSNDTNILNIYEQIANNQIPVGWHWKYWIFINQLAYYWNGRYGNYETNRNKREIELTKYIAIMYGLAGYHKIEDKAYYISEIKDNKCLCYSIDNMLNWNNNFKFTSNEKTNFIKINIDNLEGKWFDKKDIALCQWQTNNLGIFIWYLQDGLYYLLTKQIVISNAAVLINPIYFEVNDLNIIKTKEYNNLLDPLKPIKYIVKNNFDSENSTNLLGTSNIRLLNNEKTVNYADSLILTTKFIQENFFTIFGIPITSAKNQSLSADANLSISLCNNIAKEHDKFMKLFFKDLGIELEIENNEFNYQVQNENADKVGTGLNKNTDGDIIKND